MPLIGTRFLCSCQGFVLLSGILCNIRLIIIAVKQRYLTLPYSKPVPYVRLPSHPLFFGHPQMKSHRTLLNSLSNLYRVKSAIPGFVNGITLPPWQLRILEKNQREQAMSNIHLMIA